MKKIAFTFGSFDCLNAEHYHLVKEMRKLVLPFNEIVCVIPDDYSYFMQTKCFPIQTLEHRTENLSYLTKKIIVSRTLDLNLSFRELITAADQAGDKLFYVGYDDNKDFPGREFIKASNIPIKFIKKYGRKS